VLELLGAQPEDLAGAYVLTGAGLTKLSSA
jgi:hypothetical protein